MAQLVSAKGSDVLAWRASGDFAATFRQVLLARLEFCRSDEAQALLSGTEHAIDGLIVANDAFCLRSSHLLAEVAECSEPSRLRELTATFYTGLYDHMGRHHSAAAFYEFSTQFLQALTRSIKRSALAALGLADRQMPPLKLVAMGPAGRHEFSPFCPLQLLLVHGDAGEAELESLARFGRLVHDGFEACGLQVDGAVTPRNPQWSGSMADWRLRLAQWLEQSVADELIDFFRLADQATLYCDEGFDPEFSMACRTLFREHRAAMAFQVARVRNLSHGISIIGGMRFEKYGPHRGCFALLDNALQPLSAAVSLLSLLKDLEASSTPQRIREVLWRRELNVDMAERLLLAWHTLHELRLTREGAVHPDWSNDAPLHLNVEEMSDSDQNLLRESLETVGALQRHLGLTFNSSEG